MEFFPVFFIIFKIVVLGSGMFFAVKWHYDQDKKIERGNVLSVVGKMGAVLVLSLVALLFGIFTLARMIGLDLDL
jgi:hypothetical protein